MRHTLFTICCCFLLTGQSKAISYPNWALDSAQENSILGANELIYQLADNSQADSLWFTARRSLFSIGELLIAQLVNNSWKDISSITLTTSFTDYGGIKLNNNATAIKFYTTEGTTLKRYIKNIKVNNRWQQTITWEQELHNIIIGQTIPLDAHTNTGTEINYSSSNSSICEIIDDQLFAHQQGRAAITASQPGNLFLHPAESVVLYANVNIVSNNLSATDNTLIYPNPANSYVKIQANQIEEITIYTTLGTIIHHSTHDKTNNIKLNINHLEPSTYFVRIKTNTMAQILTLIVQK